jgi:hypothetical protein
MQPENHNKRRYSLFSKTLKSCVDPVVRPVLKSHGTAASKLISEWEHIVGKELCEYTLPVKLIFAKDKNAEGTLTIACDGVQALALQHMQPVIIERIASYFGYRAVTRISIEQRQVSQIKVTKPTPKRTEKKLDTACLANVEDDDLKNALSGLAKTFTSHTLDD